jgi:hypothetical protein
VIGRLSRRTDAARAPGQLFDNPIFCQITYFHLF